MRLRPVIVTAALAAVLGVWSFQPLARADARDGACRPGEGQTLVIDWSALGGPASESTLVRCIVLSGAPGDMSAYPVPDGNPLTMPLAAAGVSYTEQGMVTNINGIAAPAGSYWHFVKGEVTDEGGQWLGKESWFPDPIVDSFLGITLSDGIDVVPVVVPKFDAPEPSTTTGPGNDPSATSTPGAAGDPTSEPSASSGPTTSHGPTTAASGPPTTGDPKNTATASAPNRDPAAPTPSADAIQTPAAQSATSTASAGPATPRTRGSVAVGGTAPPTDSSTASATTPTAPPAGTPTPTPSGSPIGGAPSPAQRVWGRESADRRDTGTEQTQEADRARAAALVVLGVAVLGGLGGTTALGTRRSRTPIEEEA